MPRLRRNGVPRLFGPFTVDYTDIPHDGDTMTLWTPLVGDVLLRLFADWQTVIQWRGGDGIAIGQNIDLVAGHNMLCGGIGWTIGRGQPSLDNVIDGAVGDAQDGSAAQVYSTATVFHSTDPVQIEFTSNDHSDATQGHVALFALLARAVAP